MIPSPTQRRGPMWGNFIGHADEDLIAAAVLSHAGALEAHYYHAQQAVEKYLKALAIAIKDPDGRSGYSEHEGWIRKVKHNLPRIAERCLAAGPFYSEPATVELLEKVTEWSECTRYPWVPFKHYGRGHPSVSDLELLLRHVRNDLPIMCDDYLLGMIVRGFHHFHPEIRPYERSPELAASRARQLAALRSLFRNPKQFVHWPQIQRPL